MKSPKQEFSKSLIRDVRDYHTFHRDRSISLVKFVTSPDGLVSILTRVTDEYGKKVSCLLDFYYIHAEEQWHIYEYQHCDRKNEFDMVQGFMTEEDDC